MFRLQNNVPDIYVNESRDFQLLCRLYDAINNGVKFDIDTIVNLIDPLRANDRLLKLLANRIGFITDKEIEPGLLRYILSAFPWAVKYKGSKMGIKLAVSTILKYEGRGLTSSVSVDSDSHTIAIYVQESISNKLALDEFLKYILPCGYSYSIVDIAESDYIYKTGYSNFDNVYIRTNAVLNTSDVAVKSELDNYNKPAEFSVKTTTTSNQDAPTTTHTTAADGTTTTVATYTVANSIGTFDKHVVSVKTYKGNDNWLGGTMVGVEVVQDNETLDNVSEYKLTPIIEYGESMYEQEKK